MRFTPTCVGKTPSDMMAFRKAAVHPHVCGENGYAHIIAVRLQGSPPRVWGKPAARVCEYSSSRFTPTCVGKTRIVSRVKSVPPVHPHVCGENETTSRTAERATGSPPRVWGKPGSVVIRRGASRFTPTCVGKTQGLAHLGGVAEVHPHVCGENDVEAVGMAWAEGSPPRVWGKQSRPAQDDGFTRFTPTCVGKTKVVKQGLGTNSVHPHVCGENRADCRCREDTPGSPPRVWGKRVYQLPRLQS